MTTSASNIVDDNQNHHQQQHGQQHAATTTSTIVHTTINQQYLTDIIPSTTTATTTTTATAISTPPPPQPPPPQSSSLSSLNVRTSPSLVITSITGVNDNNNSTRLSMQTDEEFNIRFVNLVRQHKCLYDKKVPEYRNRDNQEKSWQIISQQSKESVVHCKERWRNLRACLSRYIKQQMSSEPQHKPYYLIEHMAFLLPFLKSTRHCLDGNNSFATLFQYSQQQEQQQMQQQQQQQHQQSSLQHQHDENKYLITKNYHHTIHDMSMEVKHSLSDDEETLDAFDPAITANLQQTNDITNSIQQTILPQPPISHSPTLSETGSVNTFHNLIPDVQIAESAQDITFVTSHTHNHAPITQHDDYSPESKRIKIECHASEATTTAHMGLYNCESPDMEFFRSILPDIVAFTPQQKRKFKIGILELIDEVVDRFPADRTPTSSSSTSNRQRRNSMRDWRK